MAKLLVVEGSMVARAIFKELLDKHSDFYYNLASNYAEAEALLQKTSYDFAVVDRELEDAPKGEVIALVNKHNIAPLVFTQKIDEVFFESFASARIIDYITKQKYNSITYVLQKLKQIQINRETKILVVSSSSTYANYLKHNLDMHNFKVLIVTSNQEAYEKIETDPDISLMIVDNLEFNVNARELVESVRQRRSKKSLKIIVLADHSNSFFTSSLLGAGANDYILKPFSRDEFYIRIYQNVPTISLD